MVQAEPLETRAQQSLARVEQVLRGERHDRLRTIASAFATLSSVAPVNAALALIPALLIGPVASLIFLLPFLVIGISVSLLLQAATQSASLNWSLMGLLCTAVFLAISFYDLARASFLAWAWWLKLHYRFLLGDS